MIGTRSNMKASEISVLNRPVKMVSEECWNVRADPATLEL